MSQSALPPPRNTAVIVIIIMALVFLFFGKKIKEAIQKGKMNDADAAAENPPANTPTGSTGTGTSTTTPAPKPNTPTPTPSKEDPAPAKPNTAPPADCKCATGWFGDKSYLGKTNVSRAMRNNNPCNLKRNNADWKCKIPYRDVVGEELYEQFYCYKYGVRAAIKQVQTLIKGGHNTIRKLVQAWDSKMVNDNDYVAFLAKKANLNADQALDPKDKDRLSLLVSGIAEKESSNYLAVTYSDFNKAWAIL